MVIGRNQKPYNRIIYVYGLVGQNIRHAQPWISILYQAWANGIWFLSSFIACFLWILCII